VGVGVDVFDGRPALLAWSERVKKAIGEELFAEGHELIMKASGLTQELQNNKDMEMLKSKYQKLFS